MSAGLWSSVRGQARRAAIGPGIGDVPPCDEAPPTDAQLRLLQLDRLRPGATSQNLHFAYRLRGRLDVPSLERALACAWARHQGLRSHFPAIGEQRFHAPEGWRMDASRGPGETGWAHEQARMLASTPFDLSRDRLFRAGLYPIADDDHLLVLAAHHVVFDAWSLDILLGELELAYEGRESTLAALRTSFAQYAAWQHARAAHPPLAEPLREHWSRYLDGRPVLIGLDPTAPAGVAGPRRQCERRLSCEVSEPLRELGARHGASLFAVLLAAFGALVAERSGERDFAVLTPAAGRTVPALHDLIGYFVALHPLRVNLDHGADFDGLVTECGRGIAGALEHPELPTRLATTLCGAAPGAAPLMFGLQNTPARPLRLAGLDVTEEQLEAGQADFRLYVNVRPAAGGELTVVATYDAARHGPEWVQSLLDDYVTIASDYGAHPSRAVPTSATRGPGAGPVTPRARQLPDEIGPLVCLRRHVADLTGADAGAVDVERCPLELGLDSLKLIELALRMRADLLVDAPLGAYAQAVSLRSLAEDLLLLQSASRRPAPDEAVEVLTL